MTKKVIFYADEETRSKLDNLAEDSNMSKVIRNLILREWDVKNNSIRVPIIGKLNGETIRFDAIEHTVIGEENV